MSRTVSTSTANSRRSANASSTGSPTGPVDQRGAVAQVAQQVRSHLFRAVVDLRRRGEIADDRADAPHGRIQNGGQRLQIAVGARGDEPFGDDLMFGVADVGDPRPDALQRCELRPGPPRELATGADGPAHRLGDLLERHLEDVVQDERHPLTGTQPPQHLQQRGADLVVERDPVGGIGLAATA